MSEMTPDGHTPGLGCDAESCYCPSDVFWGRLLGAGNIHAGTLRSIAKSIEPSFPTAADCLRGVARLIDDGHLAADGQIQEERL